MRKKRDPLVTPERVTPKQMKEIRTSLGLSQPEFARFLLLGGHARQTICDNELGRRKAIYGPLQLLLMALRGGWRPKGVTLPCDAQEVACCGLCDLRAEDPQVKSCTRRNCPLAQRKAA